MVSTFTPNIQLEEPARGDQVGVWDTPVNNNMTLVDLVVGGTVSISLNNSPVVLSAAQFECKTLFFSSTLTGNVDITFPTSFTKSYEIFHSCTGSSAFTITLRTTLAGSNFVCAPPGTIAEIANLGGNIYYKNLERIGSYWDYAGSSVPNWVSGCAVAPYLATIGSTFVTATYPVLAMILGGGTLPDTRGRTRVAADGGAGRLSSAVAGFNPDTVGAGGGSQNPQQHTHTISITDPGHAHVNTFRLGQQTGGGSFPAFGQNDQANFTYNSCSATTGITATASNSGTGTAGNIPPAYIGGITMIRAG